MKDYRSTSERYTFLLHYFHPICTEMRLAAGLCPDPLGEHKHSSKTPSCSGRRSRGRGKRKGKGERGKGEGGGKGDVTPPKKILVSATVRCDGSYEDENN